MTRLFQILSDFKNKTLLKIIKKNDRINIHKLSI
jgi:hypothetical protein